MTLEALDHNYLMLPVFRGWAKVSTAAFGQRPEFLAWSASVPWPKRVVEVSRKMKFAALHGVGIAENEIRSITCGRFPFWNQGGAADPPKRKGGSVMAMMSPQQYEESLRQLKLKVFMFGRPVPDPVDDPIIRPSMRAVAKTYTLAHQPAYRDVMTAVSHLTGERVNRFAHIHQSTEDLIQKSKMGRLLGRETGCCFQRCVGMDALNALSIITFAVDRKHGTAYHQRFLSYLRYVQEQDLDLAPDRKPDPGQWCGGLSHGIPPRRRLSPGPAYHDLPTGRYGTKKSGRPADLRRRQGRKPLNPASADTAGEAASASARGPSRIAVQAL